MKLVRLAPLVVAGALALGACGEDAPDAGGDTTTDATTDATDATDGTDGTDGTTGATSAPTTEAPETTASTAPPTTAAPDLTAELTGRTFLSSEVEGFTLVDGTQIQLAFEDGTLGASAGCNQLSGSWTIEGDVLVVPPMAQTEMACDPPTLMDQDTWLASVLTSSPTLALDGDTLTITAEGATVTLVDQEVADPDRPLEGTEWTVDSLVSADAVSSLPAGVRPPTLLFEDGTVSVDTSCNRGTGGYTIDGDTVTFELIATTRMACVDEGANEVEQHVLAVLTDSATFEIRGGTLTLTNGDDGLIAQAADDGGEGAPGDGLVGPTWQLESTTTGDTTEPLPAVDRVPTLTFDGTTVAVDAGCNTGSGEYTVEGDEITFGPIAVTLMLCPDPAGSLETTILGVLDGTVTYEIGDDGALTLTNGDTSLRYVAEA